MVEKPPFAEAKSDLAIMGRYVLPPQIFALLRDTMPGALGEIQLTDGLSALLKSGDLWGVEFEGDLLDVGTPAGWLATNVHLGRADARFSDAIASALDSVAA